LNKTRKEVEMGMLWGQTYWSNSRSASVVAEMLREAAERLAENPDVAVDEIACEREGDGFRLELYGALACRLCGGSEAKRVKGGCARVGEGYVCFGCCVRCGDWEDCSSTPWTAEVMADVIRELIDASRL